MRVLLPVLLCATHALSAAAMSPATIGLVEDRLKDAAQKRQLGTRIQALLELQAPSVSVFTAKVIPGSPAANGANPIPDARSDGELDDVLGLAYQILADKDKDALPLMEDGSSADPASNGVGILVANWSGAQGADFAGAAQGQLKWLLENVPRSERGAISHRNSEVQLWADYLYMVPPYLAYYGAVTSNKTLITESFNQIKLYREVLLDKAGYWQHIRLGSWEDQGIWTTGNGWIAMGMLRVAATIRAAGYEPEFTSELKDIRDWTAEIFNAMWPLLTKDNLFYNYVNEPDTFLDSAGTTLMAASVYRAALLFGDTKHIPSAEKVYIALGGTQLNSTANARRRHAARDTHHRVVLSPHPHMHHSRASQYLSADGWLKPVVDPHSFHQQGDISAEGQAFVLMLYAARNDWLAKENASKSGLGANVVGVGTSNGTGVGLSGAVNMAENVDQTKQKVSGAGRMAQIGLGALVVGVAGTVAVVSCVL